MSSNSDRRVGVIVSAYDLDLSQECSFGRGTIEACGYRREGRDYPMCGLKDIGRCPQVRITMRELSVEEYEKSEFAARDKAAWEEWGQDTKS